MEAHRDQDVHNYSPLVGLLDFPEGSTAALKSLKIDFKGPYHPLVRSAGGSEAEPGDGKTTVVPRVSTWSAKTLTSLSLVNINEPIAEANVTLPIHWAALTSLKLHSHHEGYLHQGHVLPILAASVNLVKLSLTLFDPTEPRAPPANLNDNAVGILPHLRTMELFGSEVPMRGLASKLTLPSLETLTARFWTNSPASENEVTLAEWVERYGAQLLDVTFDYVSLTPSALLYCLSRLPDVVNLVMIGMSRDRMIRPLFTQSSGPRPAEINAKVLRELTPRPNSGDNVDDESELVCLCPKLRRLECHMGYFERCEEEFIELIRARSWEGPEQEIRGVSRLEEVVLDFHRKEEYAVDIVGGVHGEAESTHPDIRVYYDAPDDPEVSNLRSARSSFGLVPRQRAARTFRDSGAETPRASGKREIWKVWRNIYKLNLQSV